MKSGHLGLATSAVRSTPLSELRMWTAGFRLRGTEQRHRVVMAFAKAMHEITSGDWEAAGYDTKLAFVMAADSALYRLEQDGHDLLDVLFPDGAEQPLAAERTESGVS